MIDMITYMKLRGDMPLWMRPWNDVDAMILTQLSSIDYQTLVPNAKNVNELSFVKWKERPTIGAVAQKYKERLAQENRIPQKKEELLFLVGESERFSKIRMDGFIRDTNEAEEKQFSAVTFFFTPIHAHVAFRGTDGSFIAWKENFIMSYQMPVHAQADATRYLEILGQMRTLKFSVGGHSKGGNMALYSASFCNEKVQKKIKKVYCFDAPGLLEDISEKEGYLRIMNKMTAFVPQSSVIGTIMKVPYLPAVVKSDAVGLKQHSMFTWQVTATGLDCCKDRDAFSYHMEQTINEWMDSVPMEQKPDAINEVFEIFRKNNIMTMDDMLHLDWRKMVGLFAGATRMSAKNRNHIIDIVKKLWDESRNNKLG